MSTWGELRNFTWGDLTSFTWGDALLLTPNQLLFLKKVAISEETKKQVDVLEKEVEELKKHRNISFPEQQHIVARDATFQKIADVILFCITLIQFLSGIISDAKDESFKADISSHLQNISESVQVIAEQLYESNQNNLNDINDDDCNTQQQNH